MDFLKKTSRLPATLDRLGPSVMLPATPRPVRPGLIESIFATTEQREILRERRDAALAVDVAQTRAATEVALVRTEEIKGIALKSLQVDNDRIHMELKQQMQQNKVEENKQLDATANRGAADVVSAEQLLLTEIMKQGEALGVSADRLQTLQNIVRHHTDKSLNAVVETRALFHDDASARTRRGLSRTGE